MERLHLLSVALGLACLAGVNLYLTVFITGLAINQHWIVLSPEFQSLAPLGNPFVVTIAGVLYFLEFFADKIPWVDTAWDIVHTIIRPIGGALLAIQVFGHTTPMFDVLVALLAGSTSLLTHSAKAASRLTANASPEPFSNIALSIGEDVAVLGGLFLLHFNPILALAIFGAALLAFAYFIPKVWRATRVKLWLILQKLNSPADVHTPINLPISLPSRLVDVFAKQNLLSETIAWAVPCISGRGRRIPANLFGALVATNEEPHKLVFVARKSSRRFAESIDLEGLVAMHEPKFLSDNLVILPASGKGPRYSFVFPRTNGALVEKMVEYLRQQVNAASTEQRIAQTVAQL